MKNVDLILKSSEDGRTTAALSAAALSPSSTSTSDSITSLKEKLTTTKTATMIESIESVKAPKSSKSDDGGGESSSSSSSIEDEQKPTIETVTDHEMKENCEATNGTNGVDVEMKPPVQTRSAAAKLNGGGPLKRESPHHTNNHNHNSHHNNNNHYGNHKLSETATTTSRTSKLELRLMLKQLHAELRQEESKLLLLKRLSYAQKIPPGQTSQQQHHHQAQRLPNNAATNGQMNKNMVNSTVNAAGQLINTHKVNIFRIYLKHSHVTYQIVDIDVLIKNMYIKVEVD